MLTRIYWLVLVVAEEEGPLIRMYGGYSVDNNEEARVLSLSSAAGFRAALHRRRATPTCAKRVDEEKRRWNSTFPFPVGIYLKIAMHCVCIHG